MTDLAPLAPFARVWDLTTGAVVASTTRLVAYSCSWELDKPGNLSLTFPAADPGDGTGTSGFASALLRAVQDVTGTEPKPLLLEFSLDGGTAYDSRKIVTNPVRTLAARQRTIEESGPDLASQALAYATIERATYADIGLADVLSGNPTMLAAGTIVPRYTSGDVVGMMNVLEPIPGLWGILIVPWASLPGTEAWASGMPAKMTVAGLVHPDVTDQSTYLDVNADTVIGALQTLCNRLAGAAPVQDYGHFCLDPSDAAINLSSSVSFGATATAMSCVVGEKGTSPHLTYSAASSGDVDETTTARLLLESARLETDDSTLFPAANFVGGRSIAGFPTNSRITSLEVINADSESISSGRNQWYDVLPLLGVAADDETGFLGMTILDGQVRPFPLAPAADTLSIAFDSGHHTSPTRDSGIYVGTSHGVYACHSDGSAPLIPGTVAWHYLDGLNAPVVKMEVNADPDDEGHNILWAHVKGKNDAWDGIWRYQISVGWQPVHIHPAITDFTTTDFQTFWLVLDRTPGTVFRYNIGSTDATPTTGFPVPSGKVYALKRAITVHSSDGPTYAADSIWALIDGGDQPAYYLARSTDTGTLLPADWTLPWFNPNSDSTLKGPAGEPLHIYTVAGKGITVDQAYGGPLVNLMIGTDLGIYWSQANLGDDLHWRKADMAGLDNFAVRHIAIGEGQTILGQSQNRVYAADDNDLLYSCDSGRTWEGIKGRGVTGMGVHLTSIVQRLSVGHTLPNNVLRTWGSRNKDHTSMTSSPLGLASSTHFRIPYGDIDALPDGLFIERYSDRRGLFQYRLRKQGAHLPGCDFAQLPEISVIAQVSADRASQSTIQVAQRFLAQHGVPRLQLTVQSAFTQTTAALRSLRPTHQVYVTGHIQIRDFDDTGTLRTTQVVNLVNEPFYVIKHTISKGPGQSARTETVLAPRLLAQPLSESDIAAGLQDSIRAVKIYGPIGGQ